MTILSPTEIAFTFKGYEGIEAQALTKRTILVTLTRGATGACSAQAFAEIGGQAFPLARIRLSLKTLFGLVYGVESVGFAGPLTPGTPGTPAQFCIFGACPKPRQRAGAG